MARRAFFSFHYERDAWRAGQVRNSWVGRDRDAAGFWDAASWEEVKRKGDAAIKKWIDEQLNGTSVTVVLIGAETSTRQYVDYENTQSHRVGNGLLGVYINGVKDANGRTDVRGSNPFSKLALRTAAGASETILTYDWVADNGRDNMGSWIEMAAKRAGR